MSGIPEDILYTAKAIAASDWYEGDVCGLIARAILAEREAANERCAQRLESLVEKRRKANPKAHLGNDYILSCAHFIRKHQSAASPSPAADTAGDVASPALSAGQFNSLPPKHPSRPGSDTPEDQPPCASGGPFTHRNIGAV